MYGIGALASQLFVGEATTSDMRHHTMKALVIMRRLTIVVAEYLLVQVTKHMERFDRNVRALQSALEQAPEVFESICVDLPLNIAFRVVNRLVNKVLIVQSLIRKKGIGVDRALGFDVSANLGLQMMLTTKRNNRRSNLTAALQHAHDGQLVFDPAFRDYALAPALVHESRCATNESFIYFDFLAAPTNLHGLFGVHRKANAVHHVPGRFLRDAESACNLIGTDTVLAVRQHPHGYHPLVHAERRILKNRADFDGELFLASLAEPNLPRRDEGVLCRLAARASNCACRPAQRHRIVESLLRVAKESYRLLQGLGKCEALCHG